MDNRPVDQSAPREADSAYRDRAEQARHPIDRLPKQAVNSPPATDPRDEITIAPDAPHRSTSRDFLP
jgi:hypothetical protein